jgi:hypothetical protein
MKQRTTVVLAFVLGAGLMFIGPKVVPLPYGQPAADEEHRKLR